MKLIPLNTNPKSKNHGKYCAIVDDEDYDWLMTYKWSYHHGYAVTNGKRVNGKRETTIPMHRMILGLTDPKVYGDHRDHNRLNNQRYNIRKATNSQNNMNKTGRGSSMFLGVSYHRQKVKLKSGEVKTVGKGYRSTIKANGKWTYLGIFQNEEEAARVYDEAAKKYHGEFANLNFKE